MKNIEQVKEWAAGLDYEFKYEVARESKDWDEMVQQIARENGYEYSLESYGDEAVKEVVEMYWSTITDEELIYIYNVEMCWENLTDEEREYITLLANNH